MKKTLCTTLIVASSVLATYSQSGQKWATNGNLNSTGDFIGTTNNFPIDFKTNNVLRATLSNTGVFKINNLSGTTTRLLQTDASGNIIFLPQGTASQVLYGNGTWGALPTIPTTIWQTNSFGTYYGGNVGINKSNPQYALDVQGDAKISNNLIVGGGLIISQKVEATNSLKTDTVHSMTGETKFTSKVILKQQFQVDGTTLFNGTVQAGNLFVSGNSSFTSPIIAQQGLTFDGVKGISYTPSSGSTANKFQYGLKVSGIPESCAAGPQAWANHQFGGALQIYNANPVTGQYITNSGLLNLQTWSGGSSIDASIGGESNSAGLLLNYFCGNDTYINTGQYGGKVSMGKIVEVGMPTTDNTVALNIKANTAQTAAIQTLDANNQINFKVYSNGIVYSREVNIKLGSFPDYVFSRTYKLTPLAEVEDFIKKNNHLKGFETGKVYEQNGMPLGEVVRLQQEKIEELTLYLIELKKEIDSMKSKSK
jgi:cytoskeletal protein CcmA (bactofilin family)